MGCPGRSMTVKKFREQDVEENIVGVVESVETSNSTEAVQVWTSSSRLQFCSHVEFSQERCQVNLHCRGTSRCVDREALRLRDLRVVKENLCGSIVILQFNGFCQLIPFLIQLLTMRNRLFLVN